MELHIQLQYNGVPFPLPSWFVNGYSAKLDKPSMLEPYIRSTAIENQQVSLDGLKQRQLYSPMVDHRSQLQWLASHCI